MDTYPISVIDPCGALCIGIAVALIVAFVIRKWYSGSNSRKATFFRAGFRIFPLMAYAAGVANECLSVNYLGNAPLSDVNAYMFGRVSELLAVTRVMPGLIIVATVGLLAEALVGRIEKWRMQGEAVVPPNS